MANIGRQVAIACVAMLLVGGTLILGMVWEWFWNLF
jgi:hypothetical protein